MKTLFIFLMAVALTLPSATAFNCTALDGENKNICNYIEATDWSQSEKDTTIKNIINSGGASLDGDFDSILNKPVEDTIQLNKLEEVDLKISYENKEFLIDFSSISIFGYVVYSFLKRYYLLLRFL
ncbi:MAG: hypothetical protein V1491_03060 [archaeon]